MPIIPDAAKTEVGYTLTEGTIYVKGEFLGNIKKIEAKNIKVRVRKYAQYNNAIEVNFIPKGRGRRKEQGFVQTYQPSLVILAGLGHLDPESPFGPETARAGSEVFVSRSRYMSQDPGWQNDFDKRLNEYLSSFPGAKIEVDARGWNTY